ncbi:nuclease-related domain-containing protein [Deinococcus sp. Leaf326]|uniref:nuclease-related domain-containing protein n=1 Tax=Deinococcus sp. Leaf326 TaxID=1736338 RepID=UPI0006FB993C|nr:nuclease-related domain-containing protein [Deinococcus sp. Leaf326]KQR18783.1 hypothetical protein ASF71_19950 [Deinococcus sp. Leaf326]
MIVKEHHPARSSDPLQRAGDAAEAQMAHYLKRAFGDDSGIHVFHNLRFEHEGEVAQIDHLVLHRAGMIIVESKSVTSAVRINDRDEWARQWNGRWQGMASPVLQARRQAELLRSFMQAHKEGLRNKILLGLKQGGFKAFMIDVVVAISDQGLVECREGRPEVRKADQVPDRVRELMTEHSKLAHPFSRDKRSEQWGFNLASEEFARISAFLRAKHQEVKPVRCAGEEDPASSVLPAPKAVAPTHFPPSLAPSRAVSPSAVRVQCGKCQGQDVEIKFGHTYYLKCRQCDGNTPIKLTCPRCQGLQRTRKSGRQFFAECAPCQTSSLYFTNPT